MTQNAIRTRRQRPFGASPQIHIPHSSWNRANRSAEGAAPFKPDEFWSRLGL
ncbi:MULTISPECIES: hypothetical protein [unclassified Sphingobium]|jgi:hypothetical protein|uniref:hypothetical protein n=1 Tax=unclassified Sphingobium TaxID=2611147 RepID=UPI0010D26F69